MYVHVKEEGAFSAGMNFCSIKVAGHSGNKHDIV